MDVELWIFITTGCLFSACVGAIAAHVATRWGIARDLEEIAKRKDTAVEAAMDTAFELQRISGDHPAVESIEVEPFMADSGYRRPCGNNCGRPAVFAWETDGFPFAACNLCVELWFPDGLPDHVVRLDQPSSEAECNIGGGTSTPNEANAILHPVEWVHLRCSFCGHWERGQFTKEQVAEWLRVHRNAMVGHNEGHTTTASTCPHPCGTPAAISTDDDTQRCVYSAETHAYCGRKADGVWTDGQRQRALCHDHGMYHATWGWVRSPGPVDDDTSDMRSLPHGRVD